MEKSPPPHPRPHLHHQPHDFHNKGFHESSSSSPPNLAVSTELSLSSSFFSSFSSSSSEPSFTKTKSKRNIDNKERLKPASSSKPCYNYHSNTKTYLHHQHEGNIISQPSSSSHGRCSTALKLYDDPWKIKKVLTTSDLGKLNRLLLSTENSMEDLVVSLMGKNNNNNNNNNNEELMLKGRPVRVWDVETKSMHQLILKQWASIKNYVLIGNWNQDFVKRRNLKKGDEIGLQWDPYKFCFNFSVLKRSSAMDYQASIQMAPYEVLYRRKCQSALCWNELSERKLYGPELVNQTSAQIQIIRKRLLAAQSQQKSYADKRRRPLEFEVGDHVFLRVSPVTGIGRAIKRKKLSPRYIGPFEILARIGLVAYRIALSPNLRRLHDVFHVSQLQKYQPEPFHIVEYEEVELQDNFTYTVEPEQIIDREDRRLRHRSIPFVKVIWKGMTEREATWEAEADMRRRYPEFMAQVV